VPKILRLGHEVHLHLGFGGPGHWARRVHVSENQIKFERCLLNNVVMVIIRAWVSRATRVMKQIFFALHAHFY
jgi:hypothetical protein